MVDSSYQGRSLYINLLYIKLIRNPKIYSNLKVRVRLCQNEDKIDLYIQKSEYLRKSPPLIWNEHRNIISMLL